MKSFATRRFWRLFHQLPREIQTLATKNYQLWINNPLHSSLRFRRLEGKEDLVTVRVGDHFRALGLLEPGAVTWIWIGSHAEYDQMTRN